MGAVPISSLTSVYDCQKMLVACPYLTAGNCVFLNTYEPKTVFPTGIHWSVSALDYRPPLEERCGEFSPEFLY